MIKKVALAYAGTKVAGRREREKEDWKGDMNRMPLESWCKKGVLMTLKIQTINRITDE